jgi:NADPH:quinone reductase-like Zn-dependent oxidoreductase
MSSTNEIPQKMNGVQLVKYGPSKESLVYSEEIPVPKIKLDTQVLVRIKAAGINPIEPKIASGNMKLLTSSMSFPCIIGADFSGVIVSKGAKVKDFELGDEVYGSQQSPFGLDGTYAQYTVVDTNKASIAKKPKELSFEQAASAGIAVLTAYQGIIKHGQFTEKNINEKRNILIIGASGGVGSTSVLLSKAFNSENYVVGICSEKNVEYVKSLGADRVVDYKDKAGYEAFINEKNIAYDVIFDCVGGEAYFNQLDKLLKKDGVYSSAVGPVEHVGSESIGVSTAFSVVSKVIFKKLFAPHKYAIVTGLPQKEFGSKVAPLFEKFSNNLDFNQKNIIPLKEAAKAHELLLSHRTIGKIVLSVD